jgi:hypothetical protein
MGYYIHYRRHHRQLNSNNSISHIKDKHSRTFESDPSHYLALAFNNSFPNIDLKFSARKETESIVKSLEHKNKWI